MTESSMNPSEPSKQQGDSDMLDDTDVANVSASKHVITNSIEGDLLTGEYARSIEAEIYIENQSTGYSEEQVSDLITQLSKVYQPKPFNGQCPYVGLVPFNIDDGKYFFGREKIVNELINRVKKLRFMVVAGPSGSGKSSLVRAGLIYQLKQGRLPDSNRWFYETLKPGSNPLEELARVTSSLTGSLSAGEDILNKGQTDPTLLHKWINIAIKDERSRRVILLVDQFEEIFTQVQTDAERTAFLNLLIYAATIEKGSLTVIFTLRSDFISDCANYPRLNALLNITDQFVQIGSMAPDELVSAMAIPAVQAGLRIDPDLIAEIINDMGKEPGALPLMQFTLKNLFDTQQSQGGVIALTREEYLTNGGIQRALEKHATAELNRLDEAEQSVAKTVFTQLIRVGRDLKVTRRTTALDEIAQAYTDPAVVHQVINRLADARLIITDKEATKETVETVTLAHERLIEAWPWLRRLVEENSETISIQNQVSEDASVWKENKQEPSYLYTGARLGNVREKLILNQLSFSGDAKQFVQTSIDTEEQKKIIAQQQHYDEIERERKIAKKLRRLVSGLAIALLITFLLTIITRNALRNAEVQRANAQAAATAEAFQRQTADSEKRKAQAAATSEAFQRQIAENEKENAQRQASRQLAARSLSLIDTQLDLALLLSLAAHSITDTIEAQSALLAGLTHYPYVSQYLHGHKDSVQTVAFSPDGQMIASAGDNDGTILIHKAEDYSHTLTLNIANSRVTKIVFSPNGELLATGDEKGFIKLWDIAHERQIGDPIHAHRGKVTALKFFPNGQTLASSCSRGKGAVTENCESAEIKLWDIASRKFQMLRPTNPVGWILDLAIDPQGKLLASAGCRILDSNGGCEQGEVVIWDTDSPSRLNERSVYGHSDAAQSLAFSPDGKLLISGGRDGNIIVWDVITRKAYGPYAAHKSWVTSLVINQSGRELFSSSCNNLVPESGGAKCQQGDIVIWNIQDKTLARSENLVVHNEWVTSLAYDDHRNMLLSGGGTALILWNRENRPLGTILSSSLLDVNPIVFNKDSKTVASGGCTQYDNTKRCITGRISLWSLDNFELINSYVISQQSEIFTGEVLSLAFSPAFDSLLAVGGCISLNVENMCQQGTILLLDTTKMQLLARPLIGHKDVVSSLAFSPDGSILASGSNDASIILWSPVNHQLIKELNGHEARVSKLSFSFDGALLASGSRDSSFIVWNVASGQALMRRAANSKDVSGQVTIAFSQISDELLSGGISSHPITFWDVESGTYHSLNTRSAQYVRDVAYSNDGQKISWIDNDGAITLWDVSTGIQIGQFKNYYRPLPTMIAFSPDKNWLVSNSGNQIVLYPVSFAAWRTIACQVADRDMAEQEWRQFFGDEPQRKIC